MKIHIETERLILRDFEESDVQNIFDLDSDPEVHQYLGNHPMESLEEAENIVTSVRKQYIENGMGRWAVVDKATNEFIGWSGLKLEKEVRPIPYYDLGYRFKKKFWGQGIATETAEESLKYGFTRLNLPEIHAGADINNTASNKVLKNIGLTLLETFDYEGMPHNWYGINKSEWINSAK